MIQSSIAVEAPEERTSSGSTPPGIPTVSVVIPAADADHTLRLCLDAVFRSTLLPLEVVVVCDGVTDRTAEVARESGARVVVNETRCGAAHARNAGAALAEGDILFFLDADCVLGPDTIATAVEAIKRGPDAVFGSYTRQTRVSGFFTHFKNYQHHYTHQVFGQGTKSFWTGCGAVKRATFIQLGGFDTAIHGIEDVEFGYALWQAGKSTEIVKDLQVEHLKRYGFFDLVRSDLFGRAYPWTKLVLTGRSEFGQLNTRSTGKWSVALTALVWLTLALAPFQPWSLLVSTASACGMLALNAGLISFVERERGPLFALASMPTLFVHFTVCIVGFALGFVSQGLWAKPRLRSDVLSVGKP